MAQEKALTLTDLKKLQEDDELDLSTRHLTKVPKSIAELSRLRIIDLSRNSITILPDEICKITTLYKLDLSSNQVHHLPHDFGKLTKLEHLDLLNNKLEDLPLSFANLKSLKYLDLKRNPLDERLQKVAGKCGNNKECKEAAKSVVLYMNERKGDLEKLKNKENAVNKKLQQEAAEQKAANQALLKAQKKKENAKQQHAHEARKPEPKKQEKSKRSDKTQKPQEKPSRGLFSRLFSFIHFIIYYGLLTTLLASTVTVLLNCSDGGKKIAGSKPLCADLTRLSSFQKPSDNFLKNVKTTYGNVLQGYKKSFDFYTADARKAASKKYATFAKTDAGKTFEKYVYKAHAWVVEKALIVSRIVQQQWKALNVWYEKEGHKTFGAIVENVKAFALIVYDATIEVARLAADGAAILIVKAQKFYHAFLEGGFNKAINTL